MDFPRRKSAADCPGTIIYIFINRWCTYKKRKGERERNIHLLNIKLLKNIYGITLKKIVHLLSYIISILHYYKCTKKEIWKMSLTTKGRLQKMEIGESHKNSFFFPVSENSTLSRRAKYGGMAIIITNSYESPSNR